jgi:hypothetical protein
MRRISVNNNLDMLMVTVNDIKENLHQLQQYIQQHINNGRSVNDEVDFEDFKLPVDDDAAMDDLCDLLKAKTRKLQLVYHF